MKGWLQVFTGIEFSCKAATQGRPSRYISNFANAVANERRTNQLNGAYWIRTR